MEVKVGNNVAPANGVGGHDQSNRADFTSPARLADIKRCSAAGSPPVTARPQDSSDELEQGMLRFIDNSVDTTTGAIKLKGTFQNKDCKLLPGQFLNVTLRLTTQPKAVTVPNQAVQNGQDGQFIYVVKEERKVEARNVEIGTRMDLDLVIQKGIDPGETVVTEGRCGCSPEAGPRPAKAAADGGTDAVKGRFG